MVLKGLSNKSSHALPCAQFYGFIWTASLMLLVMLMGWGNFGCAHGCHVSYCIEQLLQLSV